MKRKIFDLDNFFNEVFGEKEDHFSFKEIQAFARAKNKNESKFKDVRKHLELCDRCDSIFKDILKFDPLLNEKHWKAIWEDLSKDLNIEIPEELSVNIEKGRKKVLDKLEDDLKKELDTFHVEYLSKLGNLFKKSASYENNQDSLEKDLEQFRDELKHVKENIIRDCSSKLNENLTSLTNVWLRDLKKFSSRTILQNNRSRT